ncbi:fungal specific transcription factor domain-containing protein [Cordyceps javanica]|nr:fungal specific transcription factor domain-containing protein [Cordyceps javanica]
MVPLGQSLSPSSSRIALDHSFDDAANMGEWIVAGATSVFNDWRIPENDFFRISPHVVANDFHAGTPLSPHTDACDLGVSAQLAVELIDIYFDKIQAWLPLLHRPRFYAQYNCRGDTRHQFRSTGYSIPESLLLQSMFALAARFSPNPYFQGKASSARGESFARNATQCYDKLRVELGESNLLYLQGCILLANYLYTSGPYYRAWILTGVCARLAYDLDLCNMDGCQDVSQDQLEWTQLEERRRAFWLVWELDTFGSTLSKRPTAINNLRMAVRLPVSDEMWFAEKPVQSVVLHSKAAQAWKGLLDCPNQDERAWFLTANYLMAASHDLYLRQSSSQDEQDELSDSILCFALAFSQRFGLEACPLVFDSENFSKCNWIISTHLMLASARISLANAARMALFQASSYARECSRILRSWHPDYIALSHPFVTCLLLPVWIPSPRDLLISPQDSERIRTMPYLVLKQIASVWGIGSERILTKRQIWWPYYLPAAKYRAGIKHWPNVMRYSFQTLFCPRHPHAKRPTCKLKQRRVQRTQASYSISHQFMKIMVLIWKTLCTLTIHNACQEAPTKLVVLQMKHRGTLQAGLRLNRVNGSSVGCWQSLFRVEYDVRSQNGPSATIWQR